MCGLPLVLLPIMTDQGRERRASGVPVPRQAPATDASCDLVGPSPSLTSTTSAGEACPPVTSVAQVAPRLTANNTHWLLRVLEAYEGERSVTQSLPFSKGSIILCFTNRVGSQGGSPYW